MLRGDVDVGFDFYAGLQARDLGQQGQDRRDLRRGTQSAAARCADREGKRFSRIHRDQLERSGRGGRHAGRVLAILNQHINAALSDPALQATASTLGMDARGSTPEEMRDRMAADIQKWAAVIEKAGIEKQ